VSDSSLSTDFDLDAVDFPDNFAGVAQEVLATCPVANSRALGGYKVVFRDEDIRRIARDWEAFSNRYGYEPNRNQDENARLYPLEIDPPYQSRWRSVLGPYLGSRAVAAHEDNIRVHANDLIDGFIERGSCDFVDEYAAQLPGRVFFSTFLRVPFDDLLYIQQATDDAVRLPRGEDETEEEYARRRAAGWNRVGEYLENYMRMREKEPPRGDFVDAIMRGVETDEGEPAPWKHKLFVMIDVLAGGLTTTTFVLAGVAHFLATHPEERQRLADDPSLHPGAIEELFRYYASILALGRTAMKDTEVAGQKVKKGELLMLAYSVGCRDPRLYENPDTIDIERPIKSNLAFGWGPHRCPGSHIARLQARITLEELIRRMPELQLAEGETPKISHSTVTRNWDTLALAFPPGSRNNPEHDGGGPQ
jgi:cytochrome P450